MTQRDILTNLATGLMVWLLYISIKVCKEGVDRYVYPWVLRTQG